MEIVEALVQGRPSWQQERIWQIHSWLSTADPRIVLKKSYGLPFYYLQKTPYAYIHVPCGLPVVHLAFMEGSFLAPMPGILVGTDRKRVRFLEWTEEGGPEDELALAILQEALLLTEKKLRG